MSNIEISYITAAHNCLDFTKSFLNSLERTVSFEHGEVILVDDASTDGTFEFFESLSNPPYRVFKTERNLGFARANNLGVNHARGDLLCFLNNDLVLKHGWLEPMLELLTCVDQVGAVGNIQRNPGTGLIDHAGVFFDLFGRPTHARAGRKQIPGGDWSEWNAVTAACLLLPKPVFEDVGGFDEEYVNSFEDIDLCVKLRQRGYRLVVSHKSVIQHFGRSSPGRRTHDRRNTQRFLEKWQHITREWGRQEWAGEYLRRHARQWWRFNLLKLAHALWLVGLDRVRRTSWRSR